MCGISGFIGKTQDNGSAVRIMTDEIVHRGPDSSGFYVSEDIAMGFRRLSIIDVEHSDQPIFNEDKTLVLTFNGEIYNYKILRTELEKLGHNFRTKGDGEVLVHGFEEWHEDMLLRLRGMFAFVIYNIKNKSLFAARDFFGVKPFFWAKQGNFFIWCSEIKGILKFPEFRKIFDESALDVYLSFQYCPGPKTFFKNILSLLPGHYLWVEGLAVKCKKYFDPKFKIKSSMSLDEAVCKIREIVENSIKAHRISDVEVGCFLSSGIDSSYISSFFKGHKAFTVGFDYGQKYNETDLTVKFAKEMKLDYHCHLVQVDEFWDSLKTVMYMTDQPLADPACVALYFVAKEASKHVKVVLSGEGADELFAGYTYYNNPRVFNFYHRVFAQPLRSLLAKIVNKIPFNFKGKGYLTRGEFSLEESFIGQSYIFDFNDKQKILKSSDLATKPQSLCKYFYEKTIKNYDNVTKMQYIDMKFWLTWDILLKADRMSMANSLELRVPFLDIEVFKVASQIPTKFKINKLATKFSLRLASMNRLKSKNSKRKKLGFPVPIRVWLKQEKYFNKVRLMFESKNANKFFRKDFLLKLLEEHYKNKRDNSRKIWTVYVFLIWYEIYFCSSS
ncbi:MAG: asparagine synthase (glutamine-hydrolyzing) [Oscillospiraceae bacterium]|jgi:asparagine synthase (glutamine-hydrolysing)|nr:asparagine synthase (glutamine-hydrolyzing) [Oscillospiraceae bacterium]